MPAFKRVFRAFPGFDVITNIESINILDIAPPGQVLGAGSGVVLVVGEFENGSVNVPTEVFGTNDLLTGFGGLGFAVASNGHAGPVASKSGGDELWNGNGFVWLRNKRFSRLLICRVNNSAGSVAFSRTACLTGGGGPFAGVVDTDTVEFTRDGTTPVTATFSATPGTIAGDGFPGDASRAWQVDVVGGAPDFVDETSGFNDATDANFTPFIAGNAATDYVAIGRASGTFSQVTFDNANGTAGTVGVVVWEYSTGPGTWAALAGVTDGTAGFTTAVADGQVLTFTVPTDWARGNENGDASFFVRARITTPFTIDPIYDQGFVAGNNVTGFVGGETLEIKDGADATRVVVFTAADQTITQCGSRINAVLASSVAALNGTQIDLSSTIAGGLGRIEVVGGTGCSTLGFPQATQQQVDTFTVTNQTDGVYTMRAAVNVAGVVTNFDATYTSSGGESTTLLRNGILAAQQALNVPGVTYTSSGATDVVATGDANISFTSTVDAEPTPSDVTIALTTPIVATVAFGLGNVPNVASIADVDAVAVFDALAGISAEVDADSNIRVCNSGTPVTGTLQVTGGTVVTNFGFNTTDIADAANGEDVTIPAGTRVQDSTATGTIWVTLDDIETGTAGGAFTAQVRPFIDNDSALASTAGNVSVILDTLPDGFTVTNAASITRLSASQLDSRYQTALDATLDQSSIAREANTIASTRSSATIMRALKFNAIDATAAGLAARKAVVRPPLGTTRTDAKGATGVGVGFVGRDERVMYLYPGFTTQVPEIAEVGALNGGTGFTDDGVIEVGADSFYCSTRSILPPEENAGQRLSDTNVVALNVLALENAFNSEKGGVGLVIEDYQSFLANGIIAPRISRTSGAIFQSDVTSVDPAVDNAKQDANRRFFADLIIDTLAEIGVKFAKKLNTPKRNLALIQEIRGFLRLLQSPNQPETSRLDSYQVFDDTTDDQRSLGIVFIIVKVKMFSAMKFITFRTEVGPSVVIEEAA